MYSVIYGDHSFRDALATVVRHFDPTPTKLAKPPDHGNGSAYRLGNEIASSTR